VFSETLLRSVGHPAAQSRRLTKAMRQISPHFIEFLCNTYGLMQCKRSRAGLVYLLELMSST